MFFFDFNYDKIAGKNFVRLPVSSLEEIEATFVYLATMFQARQSSLKPNKVLNVGDEYVPLEREQSYLTLEQLRKEKVGLNDLNVDGVKQLVELRKILTAVWRLQEATGMHLVAFKDKQEAEETVEYLCNKRSLNTNISRLTPQEFGAWIIEDITNFVPKRKSA